MLLHADPGVLVSVRDLAAAVAARESGMGGIDSDDSRAMAAAAWATAGPWDGGYRFVKTPDDMRCLGGDGGEHRHAEALWRCSPVALRRDRCFEC